jgi:phospholipid/cholesterol/gamma-HCH transport system substrate-binding protein
MVRPLHRPLLAPASVFHSLPLSMARRLAWSDVRGGLIAIVVVVGISVATLKYARVGALRGDTFRLYALVSEARGILKGSEVWLSGQKIGKVADIRFRSPQLADTATRLLLELQVMEKYRAAMHRDAEAQIRTGGSVIGAVVVYLSPGTAASPEIRDGDTLRAQPSLDVEGSTAEFGAAVREFPAIMKNVKSMRAELEATRGTLGAVMNEGFVDRGPLLATGRRLTRLRTKLSDGEGTVSKVMAGGLSVRARTVLARTDSVRRLVASSGSSYGRFRRDSTLVHEVADIRAELALVETLLTEPRGTAGRVLHDSAMTSAVGDAKREMGLLVTDLKKHPLRYNPF